MSTGLARNSRRSYSTSVHKYLSFCTHFNLYPYNLTEQNVLRFITFLSNQRLLARTIKVYLAGLRAWFITSGMQPPFIYTEAVKLALKAIDRPQPEAQQVRPLSMDIISIIISSIAPNYDNLMYTTALLTAYFACMRAAEYCYDPNVAPPLLSSAVTFYKRAQPPYFTLKIPSSKTSYKGFTAVVGCSYSTICAHCAMSAYLSLYPRPGTHLLFTNSQAQPLTYKLLSHFIKSTLYKLGYDHTKFTPHSIRAGAATDAAAKGLSSEAIKKLGRWRSDTYIQYLRPTPQDQARIAAQQASSSPLRPTAPHHSSHLHRGQHLHYY